MENTEKLTLVNNIVKVVDAAEGIDNTGIVSFMYPSFLVKDEIFFDYENDVIFTGKYKSGLKAELAHGTRNFIAFGSIAPDVDFTNKETIIKVLYSKWNKEPSETVANALESMSDQEFWDYFKKFWILGKSKLEDKKVSLYNLYSVLGKQRHDILKTYFELREVYSDSTIFSGVLSFIEKSLNPDQVSSQNGRYLKMLDEFRRSYGPVLIPIVQRAYIMKGDSTSDKEYRTLWLLMQLGKGNAI